MSGIAPYLSVVVPAHRGEAVLRSSLASLRASTLARAEWELIVVDDASPDATALVAAEYADRVLRLDDGPRGPAYARNRGIEAARGEVIVFIDADVCVHQDTLAAFADAFRQDSGLAALFGSYDSNPTAPGIVSQFRNLLHHHTHQMNAGPAETFWAGCGAVRRNVLMEIGMMDAWHFPRPQIEDIELGRRLRRAGHRIELRPDIQCTHLKQWTLRSMVMTDLRDRGMPWMWMILCEGRSDTPATLNLRWTEKACTALTALTALSFVAALMVRSLIPLVLAAVSTLMLVVLQRRFYATLVRARGLSFALAAIPLHVVFFFTGGLGAVAGTWMFYMRDAPQPPAHMRAGVVTAGWPPLDRPVDSIWRLARVRTRA